MALEPGELAALRRAAALAAAVPTARIRVRNGAVPVLDVGRPPVPTHPGTLHLTTDAFRSAVAGAMAVLARGGRVVLRGVPDGASVAVDVGLPPGTRTFAGPVYDVPGPRGRVLVFVSTAPLEAVVAACPGGEVTDDRLVDARVVRVHAATPDAATLAVDRCRDHIARLGVSELERWLAAVPM